MTMQEFLVALRSKVTVCIMVVEYLDEPLPFVMQLGNTELTCAVGSQRSETLRTALFRSKCVLFWIPNDNEKWDQILEAMRREHMNLR